MAWHSLGSSVHQTEAPGRALCLEPFLYQAVLETSTVSGHAGGHSVSHDTVVTEELLRLTMKLD